MHVGGGRVATGMRHDACPRPMRRIAHGLAAARARTCSRMESSRVWRSIFSSHRFQLGTSCHSLQRKRDPRGRSERPPKAAQCQRSAATRTHLMTTIVVGLSASRKAVLARNPGATHASAWSFFSKPIRLQHHAGSADKRRHDCVLAQQPHAHSYACATHTASRPGITRRVVSTRMDISDAAVEVRKLRSQRRPSVQLSNGCGASDATNHDAPACWRPQRYTTRCAITRGAPRLRMAVTTAAVRNNSLQYITRAVCLRNTDLHSRVVAVR